MGSFNTGLVLLNILSPLNAFASAYTIYLVWALKKYNGYMLMVLAMTFAQFSYDASLFLFNFRTKEMRATQLFIGIFCGTAAAMWSLVIACVMTYIIVSKKYYNIEINFKYLVSAVTLFSVTDAIVCLIYFVNDDAAKFKIAFRAFNGIRIAIIVLTVVFICYTFYSISMFQGNTISKKKKQNPVNILTRRLCYYPLVQFLSRFPVTIYQIAYAQPVENYAFVSHPTEFQSFWFYLSTVFIPAGGLGNFVAFLAVQPDARDRLKQDMHFLTGGICGTAPQKEEDKWLQDETGSSKMDRSKKGGDSKSNSNKDKAANANDSNVNRPHDAQQDRDGSPRGGGNAGAMQGALDSYYDTQADTRLSHRGDSMAQGGANSRPMEHTNQDINDTSLDLEDSSTKSDNNNRDSYAYEENAASSANSSAAGSFKVDFEALDEEELVREIARHPRRTSARGGLKAATASLRSTGGSGGDIDVDTDMESGEAQGSGSGPGAVRNPMSQAQKGSGEASIEMTNSDREE